MLASKLQAAESPLIVIGGNITYKEAMGVAELVKVLGKGAGNILLVQNKPNSLGLIDAGVKASNGDGYNFKDKVVLIYGEDLIKDGNSKAEKALKEADFLLVCDMFLTDTAKMADVVLPITSFSENEGTYTNSEGKVQKVNKLINPKTGKSNTEVIKSLLR